MKTLRDRAVASKVDISKAQVWAFLQQDPSFPRPIRLSPRITVWDEAEIDAWLITKKGNRDGTTSRPAE